MKTAILFFTLVLVSLAVGCAKKPTEESKNVPANYAATETPQADGSTVTVAEASNGVKSEVRYFPAGQVIQVSRATRPDGRRNATVKFRDGRTAELQDAADIDRVIEASIEDIAAMAGKVVTASAPPVPAEIRIEPQAPAPRKGGKR